MRRGEIYYIDIPEHTTTGREMRKSRPGIVVSPDDANRRNETVLVVFLSASTREACATHAKINSTPLPSTALCEHIYAVDRSRIGNYIGKAHPSEMAAVDVALYFALGLDMSMTAAALPAEQPQCGETVSPRDSDLQSQLNVYKSIYNELLDRVLK